MTTNLKEKICRICMSKVGNFVSLDSQMTFLNNTTHLNGLSLDMEMSWFQNKTLLDGLRKVSGKNVPVTGENSATFTYPMFICLRCSKLLQEFYNFAVLYDHSEAFWHNQDLKGPFEISNPSSDINYIYHDSSVSGYGKMLTDLESDTFLGFSPMETDVEINMDKEVSSKTYSCFEAIEYNKCMPQYITMCPDQTLGEKESPQKLVCNENYVINENFQLYNIDETIKNMFTILEDTSAENKTQDVVGQKISEEVLEFDAFYRNFVVEKETNNKINNSFGYDRDLKKDMKVDDSDNNFNEFISEINDVVNSIAKDKNNDMDYELPLIFELIDSNKEWDINHTNEENNYDGTTSLIDENSNSYSSNIIDADEHSKNLTETNNERNISETTITIPAVDINANILNTKIINVINTEHSDDPFYKCDSCKSLFDDINTYIKHYNNNIGSIKYHCLLCKFDNYDWARMTQHYANVHSVQASKQMVQISDINNSEIQLAEGTDINWLCPQCNITALTLIAIKEHVTKNHKFTGDLEYTYKEVLKYPECLFTTENFYYMDIFYTLKHGNLIDLQNSKIIQFVCEYCGKAFSLKSSLKSHQRACLKADSVKCSICQEQFDSRKKFELHIIKKHNIQIVHECEFCCKIYKNYEYLSIHRKRHNERFHKCDLCSNSYINNSELKNHIKRVHSTGDSVMCGICNENFVNERKLNKHIHDKHYNKVYECANCPQTFPTESRLRCHRYEHTGKPYACDTCKREFISRSAMRRHCTTTHNILLSDVYLKDMFIKRIGYTSRYDAFLQNK